MLKRASSAVQISDGIDESIKNEYSSEPTILKSYFSICLVTVFNNLWYLDNIHLSSFLRLSNLISSISLFKTSISDSSKTVQEVLTNKIATIGENMSIRRFVRFETNGLVESYIHGDGKIAVLVNFKKGESDLAKDVCMQIAAARPEFLKREDVPAERVDKEMEILKAQAMNEGKPAEIAEKMVNGRIGKFYAEVCLLDQEFVKDPSQKVGQLISSKGAEIVEFARFEKGEGIEKKSDDFASEVAGMIK